MIELFDYNKETYDKIINKWKDNKHIGIIQATGTGKGYILTKIAENYPKLNKIVLCPNKYVIYNLKNISDSIRNIEYLTYSKLSYMTKLEIQNIKPDMIFLDEYHRCGAEIWEKNIQLLLKLFPESKVLGTTATPIRYLDNMRDMSAELFNGCIVNELSLVDAISKNILPLPRYISAIYSFDEELNNLKTRLDEQKYLLNKNYYHNQINDLKLKLENSKGVSKILKKHLTINDNKFIIFCKNIKHLEAMKPTIINWFSNSNIFSHIDSYSIHSHNDDNELLLEKFNSPTSKNHIKLLFSIDMLKEGLHVKDTGVILLRETMSPITYYQQIGRALNASGEGRTPLIIDLVNNFNNISSLKSDLKKAYELHSFKKGINEPINVDFFIIDETMDAHKMFMDLEEKILDNWTYFYDKYCMYLKQNKPTSKNKPLSHWISNQRFLGNSNNLSYERKELLIRVGFNFNLSWNAKYQKYKNALNIDKSEITRNGKFHEEYNWVSSQKTLYAKNDLTKNQINKLNEIGVIWNKFDEKRNFKMNILKEYGSLEKVTNDTVYKNYPIGKWLRYFRKMKNSINSDDIEILKNLGFDIYENRDNKWLQMSEIVKKEIEKHKYIKYNHISKCGKNVGEWLKHQNTLLLKNKLNSEKTKIIKELNSSRITKKEIDEEKWNKMFKDYRLYVKEKGKYIVPKKENASLAIWINYQKRKFREYKLSEQHKNKLLKIGVNLQR